MHIAVPGHRDTRAAQPHEHGESYCWTRQICTVIAEQVLVRELEARQEEAGQSGDVHRSTETAIARRGTEKTSATMTTTEQVQEALQQLQLQVEQTRATTAEQELENSLIQTLVTTKGKGKKEAKEQRVQGWQRPLEKAAAVRTKEEGARV